MTVSGRDLAGHPSRCLVVLCCCTCYDVGWSADDVFLKIYVGHHQKIPESVERCRGQDVKRLDAAVGFSGHKV